MGFSQNPQTKNRTVKRLGTETKGILQLIRPLMVKPTQMADGEKHETNYTSGHGKMSVQNRWKLERWDWKGVKDGLETCMR